MSPPDPWTVLRTVTRLRFEARCVRPPEWNGVGEGEVSVQELAGEELAEDGGSRSVLLFSETGRWTLPDGRRLPFSNVFRWTPLTPLEDGLRLEHLRFGLDRPVFLFDLVADAAGEGRRGRSGRWVSREPHRCGEDRYAGELSWSAERVELVWHLRGPRKEGSIRYLYLP